MKKPFYLSVSAVIISGFVASAQATLPWGILFDQVKALPRTNDVDTLMDRLLQEYPNLCADIKKDENKFRMEATKVGVGALKVNRLISHCQSSRVTDTALKPGDIKQGEKGPDVRPAMPNLRPIPKPEVREERGVEQNVVVLRKAAGTVKESLQEELNRRDISKARREAARQKLTELESIEESIKEAEEHYNNLGAIAGLIREDLTDYINQNPKYKTVFDPQAHSKDSDEEYFDALGRSDPRKLELVEGSLHQVAKAASLLEDARAEIARARKEYIEFKVDLPE